MDDNVYSKSYWSGKHLYMTAISYLCILLMFPWVVLPKSYSSLQRLAAIFISFHWRLWRKKQIHSLMELYFCSYFVVLKMRVIPTENIWLLFECRQTEQNRLARWFAGTDACCWNLLSWKCFQKASRICQVLNISIFLSNSIFTD